MRACMLFWFSREGHRFQLPGGIVGDITLYTLAMLMSAAERYSGCGYSCELCMHTDTQKLKWHMARGGR